jgi:3-oxoadipate enol-lactonase
MKVSHAKTYSLLTVLLLLIVFDAALGAEPMEKGTAEVNGTSLYYEVAGKGFPLVLISGGGTLDRRAWDDQFKAFARSYRVIRYDIRGIGKSARPQATFSHSRDLYALLKFLKVKKAHVVGLSFSGAIAIDFALEHPEMVDHLVLAATGTSSDAKSQENLKSVETLSVMVEKDGLEQTIKFLASLSFFISQDNQAAREKLRLIYLDNRDLFDNGFPLVRLWQPTEPPAGGRLSEIHAPALILVAEKDIPAYKEITDKLAAGIGGAKKLVIPGATHLIHMDKPKEFNRAVLEFLSER